MVYLVFLLLECKAEFRDFIYYFGDFIYYFKGFNFMFFRDKFSAEEE